MHFGNGTVAGVVFVEAEDVVVGFAAQLPAALVQLFQHRSVGDGLEEVLSAEPDGTLRRWRAGEFSCSYRRCSLSEPGRLLLSCKMILGPVSRVDIEEL